MCKLKKWVAKCLLNYTYFYTSKPLYVPSPNGCEDEVDVSLLNLSNGQHQVQTTPMLSKSHVISSILQLLATFRPFQKHIESF